MRRFELVGSGWGWAVTWWKVKSCECCLGHARVAVCCSVLKCVEVCCSVLQCVAVCCSVL